MFYAGMSASVGTHFTVLLALLGAGCDSHALEFYRDAVQCGVIQPWKAQEPGVLDLHGFPEEVAKLAVRAAVLDAQIPADMSARTREDFNAGILELHEAPRLTFITGRGNHSDGDALLRPAVVHVLREEFGFETRI